MRQVNKKYYWYAVYICALIVGCTSSLCFWKSYVPDRYKKYIFPYENYEMASYGDIALYEKVVKERQEQTPSHPDYFDLSIEIARLKNYTPAYYNAYRALHDLYKYNHFTMGDKVKRLMYSYLQIAIEKKDKRITEEDLKSFRTEFPDGIIIERMDGKN